MKIACLVGSTKFKPQFEVVTLKLSLEGYAVLSVGCFTHYDAIPLDTSQLDVLHELHIQKIASADLVYVINPHDYLGETTLREIEAANKMGRPLRFYSHEYGH